MSTYLQPPFPGQAVAGAHELLEPHFLFPGFQFLPVAVRVWLTKADLKQLFPEATIFEERFLGLVKSFIVYTALPE